MIFPTATCSSTCAVQPIDRLTANVGVDIPRGRPARSSTTDAQYSTLVTMR
jgi:hypothetical protein